MFSLPRGNEMFQFPRFPIHALCVQAWSTRHDPCQVFPFGDPRINACLAASRGLSQPATSFIGFQRQGIHRVPFSTCRDDARARYGVHKVQSPTAGASSSRRARCERALRSNGSPESSRADALAGTLDASLKAAQCAQRLAPTGSLVMTAERSPQFAGWHVKLISQ